MVSAGAGAAGAAGGRPRGGWPTDLNKLKEQAEGSTKNFWAETEKLWNTAVRQSKSKLDATSATFNTAAKELKSFTMTVDTKVDFIGPALESARSTSRTLWSSIPPPLQSHLARGWPFAAVATGSWAGAKWHHRRAWSKKEAKYLEEMGSLMESNSQLHDKLRHAEIRENLLEESKRVMQSKYDQIKIEENRPNPQIIAMTKHVAEATKAAASAATAAAQASRSCIRPPVPPDSTNQEDGYIN
mmetsp:Transcript_39298/g.54597  ORF Transcript_39298/g.54597 Transcript_39298/m.54597 type:complete len:243 (+) Transcript_39298:43-771(+)|eukprot:CAMPEP_0196597850 /NCGR_PEP_ID=MMETSP1081-20130531/93286_1 /TAXON_ID=36882 /ORGANISM="Pyramimonas amylifera, Strain CCMP720" /LENGTH=242 /DNA_ID=CAMNT_0041923391 /DNA_START=31 /DNA_END=759 /DNA_ORIENTATION=+